MKRTNEILRKASAYASPGGRGETCMSAQQFAKRAAADLSLSESRIENPTCGAVGDEDDAVVEERRQPGDVNRDLVFGLLEGATDEGQRVPVAHKPDGPPHCTLRPWRDCTRGDSGSSSTRSSFPMT